MARRSNSTRNAHPAYLGTIPRSWSAARSSAALTDYGTFSMLGNFHVLLKSASVGS